MNKFLNHPHGTGTNNANLLLFFIEGFEGIIGKGKIVVFEMGMLLGYFFLVRC
jgi:hypothetical protein